MKMKMDEQTRKSLRGCKAGGVLLWIIFGSSIIGCVFLLATMMQAGTAGGALSLLLMIAAVPFLCAWTAKSTIRITRWIESNTYVDTENRTFKQRETDKDHDEDGDE